MALLRFTFINCTYDVELYKIYNTRLFAVKKHVWQKTHRKKFLINLNIAKLLYTACFRVSIFLSFPHISIQYCRDQKIYRKTIFFCFRKLNDELRKLISYKFPSFEFIKLVVFKHSIILFVSSCKRHFHVHFLRHRFCIKNSSHDNN